jgi:hypothetical protein
MALFGRLPLLPMAWGLSIVVVDLRVNGLDLLPDPIGWFLVFWGVVVLGGGDLLAGPSRWAVMSAVVLSVGDVVRLPVVGPIYDLWTAVPLAVLAHYLSQVAAEGGTYALVEVDDDVAEGDEVDVEDGDGDEAAARVWRTMRTLVVVAVTALAVGLALVSADPAAAPFAIVAGVATLLVVTVFVVTLFRHATRSWALAPVDRDPVLNDGDPGQAPSR